MIHQRGLRDGRSLNDGGRPLRLGASLLLLLLAALVWLAALSFPVAGRETEPSSRANSPTGRHWAASSIKHRPGVARSLRSPNNGLSQSSSYGLPVALGLALEPASAAPDAPMPYKTCFVTQACEWKSNLFVPKSNDLHFAQPSEVGVGAKLPLGGHVDVGARQQPEQESRTILSSTQKALILALPIELGADFAGFEPACSIRLIVPRNMRILAKLTARKLSFAPQVVGPAAAPGHSLPAPAPAPTQAQTQASAPAQDERQLWLNVSSDQFGELEQRELESESNVLAFRFLLERFAHRREPETRFQVVVSAFQTLGENSGFNQANPAEGGPQEQQFICDSQRLISPSLLCDGFPNCQDGSDETPANCAAFRHSSGPATVSQRPGADSQPARNQTAPSQPLGDKSTGWLAGFGPANPLVGFLLGLLLVLLLLTTCTCCLYCLYLLLRKSTFGRERGADEAAAAAERSALRSRAARQRHLLRADQISEGRRRRPGSSLFARLNFLGLGQRPKSSSSSSSAATSGRRGDSRRAGSAEETDSLARNQNYENAARLKAQALLEQAGASGLPPAPPQRQPHSILKRPAPLISVGAPLARFEAIPYSTSAGSGHAAPPPRMPQRASERAVDVGPGASSGDEQPAKPRGALAHSLTHARDSGRRTHDFRPTPAARGQARAQPPPTSTRSQDFSPTASTSGGLQATGGARETSEQLRYKSSSSQVEQTSSETGGQRLTVYQYSSSVAQFSESYLLRKQPREQPPAPPPGEPPGQRPPSNQLSQHQVQQARQL